MIIIKLVIDILIMCSFNKVIRGQIIFLGNKSIKVRKIERFEIMLFKPYLFNLNRKSVFRRFSNYLMSTAL